jgi:DNA repair ATPase RecN
MDKQIELEKCVHTEHCCQTHGCKYGDPKCPVSTGVKKQSFACEDCVEESEEMKSMTEVVLANIRDFPLPNISEDEYQKWKARFSQLKEHEKLSKLMGVMVQLFNGGEAALSVYKSMFVCIQRYIEEADLDDFTSKE